MRTKKDLAQIAFWNSIIVRQGSYISPTGNEVAISGRQKEAEDHTVVLHSDWLEALAINTPKMPRPGFETVITVTDETTAEAARRLESPSAMTAMLNFASAKRPGGGYINGAVAQEEAVCRCSGLYECLLTKPGFYKVAAGEDGFYTDHMIWSPDVPFFRDDNHQLLSSPYYCSVITAAAPNVSALSKFGPRHSQVRQALQIRVGKALALAEKEEVDTLILGAWGCGVFGNDPDVVADVFAAWLETPRFKGVFEQVVFAIPSFGKPNEPNLVAFQKRFNTSKRD